MKTTIKPLHGIAAILFFFALSITLINGMLGSNNSDISVGSQTALVFTQDFSPVTSGTTLSVQVGTPLSFELATGGTYKLVGVVRASGADMNSFYIDIDSNPSLYLDPSAVGGGKVWDLDVSSSFNSQEVSWRGSCQGSCLPEFDPKVFILNAGLHTLYINEREAGTEIQSIQFVNILQSSNETTQTLTVTRMGSGSGVVNSVPSGIVCTGMGNGGVCSNNFTLNSTVALTVSLPTSGGSTFAGWGGACTGVGACNVTMNAVKNVTATFNSSAQSVPHILTVTKLGTGLAIINSNPSGISCGGSGSGGVCSNTFTQPVALTVALPTSGGSTFAGWGGACTGTGTCNVTMNADKNVSATINSSVQESRSTLTVINTGGGAGLVTSNPSGIVCTTLTGDAGNGGVCFNTFIQNSSVTLTAFAPTGSAFKGWSGGGCTGMAATCTLTLNSNTTVTANFDPSVAIVGNYTLTVTKSGAGSGIINSIPSGISCGGSGNGGICSGSFSQNSSVSLIAYAPTGSTFGGWSGCTSSSGLTCNVAMNGNTNVTATFNPVVVGGNNNPPSGGGGGGGYGGGGGGGGIYGYPVGDNGCAPGNLFSTTTGHPCPASNGNDPGCINGNLFSTVTGYSCPPSISTGNTAPPVSSSIFKRNLTVGSRGVDVKALQQFLIFKGHLAGGNDTSYFGRLTKAALIQYQQSMSITPAVGYFGPITRNVLLSTTVIRVN